MTTRQMFKHQYKPLEWREIVAGFSSIGLRKPSQLMIDKLFTVPMAAIGEVIGVLEPAAMADLDLALRGWLELG